ncbi:SprT-like domain-containing protein [Bacillus atrophaeus]|uniref:SprT-like domain-containing protein n=1 Tax=Bacillus atrophaeus TaxID=1452 RepID=UPI002E1D7766|nr:SprT-like domain-containing protein [Bacillus atrophaeus]MED1032556.1 SprT-like domain-containing protein [Bacillus atrophaeus]MED1120948.1 SprT-like domain-containing protein [Bacillus atrophaeus]
MNEVSPTDQQITIEDVTSELHKAFDIFNNHFFDGILPVPAITIQTNKNNRNAMGWCSTVPNWGTKDGKHQMYELNLAAEFLDLDFFETMDTLLHEMVHLYHKVKGIKDTSRKGEYHNKIFRDKVLELGFEYSENRPHPRMGWTFARIGPALKERISKMDINQKIFSISKRGYMYFQLLADGKTPEQAAQICESSEQQPALLRTKSKSHKWLCPNCEVRVISYKENVNIICGDCNETLVKQ